MHNPVRAQRAGLIGMAGAVLWIFSVVMQYGLGLLEPDGSPLDLLHTAVAYVAMIGMIIGFLGLIWGGAFGGRLGPIGVRIYAVAYGLIMLGGALALLMRDPESPALLLFPIGGTLADIGVILIGIAAVVAGRWGGWQRWMPPVAAVYRILVVSVPFALGVTPDGPGMLAELGLGVTWFLVALAVYAAQARPVPKPQATVAGQV